MIVREGAIDADDAAIRAVLKAISGKPDRPARSPPISARISRSTIHRSISART
jgi:hypothetical protein